MKHTTKVQAIYPMVLMEHSAMAYDDVHQCQKRTDSGICSHNPQQRIEHQKYDCHQEEIKFTAAIS